MVREDIEDLLPILEDYAKQANFILEIGCANGNGSTVAFNRAIEKNRHKNKVFISVDIVDDFFLGHKPKSNWNLVLGDSRKRETLEEVQKIVGDRLADLIFIDTEHNLPIVEKELEVWKEIAHDKTVWLFHDTWMSGRYNPMTDAIKAFANREPRWDYVDITKDSNGLGALIPVEK